MTCSLLHHESFRISPEAASVPKCLLWSSLNITSLTSPSLNTFHAICLICQAHHLILLLCEIHQSVPLDLNHVSLIWFTVLWVCYDCIFVLLCCSTECFVDSNPASFELIIPDLCEQSWPEFVDQVWQFLAWCFQLTRVREPEDVVSGYCELLEALNQDLIRNVIYGRHFEFQRAE